jgi:hypothetical protein
MVMDALENRTEVQMKTVMEIYEEAFDQPRDPRSDEYKEGVIATLSYHITGQKMPRPYAMGTVQADAFYAGVDEGHRLWMAAKDAT